MSRFSFNLDGFSRKQKYTSGRFDAWIHSKIILYILLAASVFQLFILGNSGNYKAAIAFVIVAAIVFKFVSKNMVVILICAFAVSSIIGLIPGASVSEGMEDGSDDTESNDEDSGEKDKEKEKMTSNNKNKSKDAKEDSKVIADLKKDGEALIKTQEVIMNNFKKISPELDKVESLVASMNETANTLKSEGIKEKLKSSMVK